MDQFNNSLKLMHQYNILLYQIKYFVVKYQYILRFCFIFNDAYLFFGFWYVKGFSFGSIFEDDQIHSIHPAGLYFASFLMIILKLLVLKYYFAINLLIIAITNFNLRLAFINFAIFFLSLFFVLMIIADGCVRLT